MDVLNSCPTKAFGSRWVFDGAMCKKKKKKKKEKKKKEEEKKDYQ